MSGTRGTGGGPPRLERIGTGAGRPAGPPAPAQVTTVAALAAGLPYQGSLSEDGPLRLYYLAAAAAASGRLTVEGERCRYDLHFKRGVVEHAVSSAPEDDLGQFLLQRGVVSAEAIGDAQRIREGLAGDLVAALASLRVLNPADSFRILQEHGVAVVAGALAVERGTFRWDPAATPPSSAFPLGSRWGMLCEAIRRLDQPALRARLGARAQRLASRSGGRIELAQLKLTAHEARAAALFDGRSSPAQLAAERPGQAGEILRMALLMGETELLAFGAEQPVPVPVPEATPRDVAPGRPVQGATPPLRASFVRAAPAAAGPGAAAENGPVARAAVAGRAPPAATAAAPPRPEVPRDGPALQALQARLEGADHFEVLGVSREATAPEIKAAYFQLARTYHPDAGPPGEPAEIKKQRADVFARLGEAWGVLGDEGRRVEYLRQLASGGVAQVDVSAIFEAEELFTKAIVLVRTRQYAAAREALAKAIALNPDEAEFGVWDAWVEFLLAPDRKRLHASCVAAMEAALKKVPRCLKAYLFLGLMAKMMGDLPAAERHLQHGLALAPEDTELARELKYLRK